MAFMLTGEQILAVSAEKPVKFINYNVVRRQPILDASMERYLLRRGAEKAVLTFYKRHKKKDDGAVFRAKKGNGEKYPKKLMKVIECGFYESASCWYDITPHSQFGPLANIFATAREYSRQIAFSSIIESLYSIIQYFHSMGLAGLNLAPGNVVIVGLQPLELVLRDAEGLSGLSAASAAADYHGMGLALLEIFLSENARYAADRGYLVHSIASGELDFPPETPRHLKLLLEGLLTQEAGLRWGGAGIEKWLAGDRTMAVHFRGRAAAQSPAAGGRKTPAFFLFNNEITPVRLYEMMTGLYEGRSAADEVLVIESVIDGTMKKALAQSDGQLRTGARRLEAWLDAICEHPYACFDKKEKLDIAFNSLKIYTGAVAGGGGGAAGAKKTPAAFKKAASDAVAAAMKNELERAFSGYMISEKMRREPGAGGEAAGDAKERIDALFALKKESLLISREEYEKVAGVYKLPLEIKNALAGGDRARYSSAARDFLNMRAENLFISLEDARGYIETAGGAGNARARRYEDLERTAGYYKIAQCVKNAADEELYEKLAALVKKGVFDRGGAAHKAVGDYARAVLFKSVRWSAGDRKIINALLHVKWNSAYERIFGEAAAGGAGGGRAVIIVSLMAIASIFCYAVYAEKYYLMAFCILIFAHICYIAFAAPDYEKVYQANLTRIEDVGELCGPDGAAASGSGGPGGGASYQDAGRAEINDRFFYAVKTADYIGIKKLIQHGAEINARDPGGATPLIWAADAGNAKIIRLLAGYGAEVNARDNQGAGALMWAAYRGNAAAVRSLIEAGADINARDAEGHTPLMAACFNAHAEAVRALLDAGCDAKTLDYGGSGALVYAKNSGGGEIERIVAAHIESGGMPRKKYFGIADVIFDTMLDSGVADTFELVRAAVSVDKKAVSRMIESSGDDGDASGARLIKACASGNYEAARGLIEAGAEVNARDRSGYTALIWAIDKRRDAAADLLAASGADVNLADSYGYTPLMWAVERNDLARVKKLIDGKAEIDLADNKGLTALMWAVVKKRFDIARELMERGASADIFDHRGYGALSYAIEKNYDNFIELLAAGCGKASLDNSRPRPLVLWAAQNSRTAILKLAVSGGADVDVRDPAGRTALIHSVDFRNIDAVDFLVKNGAAVNLCDNTGAGALIHSVVSWFYDITRILIEAGADIAQKDNSGKTAMDYAMDKNYNTIIEMLAAAGADINARNYCGVTPLIWAASSKNISMAKFLVFRGADVNGRDSKGFTALMHSARNGWLEMAKMLVESGADRAARAPGGETARDLAVKNKRDKLASYLAKTNRSDS
jgi:ankyrin repeat protein